MICQEFIKNPEKQYRVDTRWWLAEGLHTDQTLKNEIKMLDEAGFGAVEFLAMEEPGVDEKRYGWGSEEWIHDSQLIIEETTQRGMGVSMTSGTNWANANLTCITPDDKAASKELDFVMRSVAAGESWEGELPKPQLRTENVHEQLLIAVLAAKVLQKNGHDWTLDEPLIDLTEQVRNGRLCWTAPEDGEYLLFFFWMHGTGQTARPSAATSYTINYMDKYGVEAFIKYWDAHVLPESLRQTLRKNGRGMMYMDSLELSTFGAGGQLWGYHLLETFKERRGYDLRPLLPFITKDSGFMLDDYTYHFHMTDALREERLRNDLYQTMTECYMENMLRPMQQWLHGHGMQLRAEIAYGLPFEISLPGKYVDGVETESLEFASQIDSYRGLAGTAHIYDRVFSSETGATKRNYTCGLDFFTQIIYTQFCAGVTRTVLHGYSSICGSEQATYWPGHEGMWPIFSERFGVRQPSFRHYRDWLDAMARYQKLLRQGKPRVDLGILRLDYNFNNLVMTNDEINQYATRQMRADQAAYWQDMSLQHAGYTWDYFAPQILEEDFAAFRDGMLFSDGPGYQALIVYQEFMPVSAAKKLLRLAQAGLPLVFVNGASETLRPTGKDKRHEKAASCTPFLSESDEELAAIIREIKELPNVAETDVQAQTIDCLRQLGVSPRAAFTTPNKNILTRMNVTDAEAGLFVYNMLYAETEPFTVSVDVCGGGQPYRADCWSGKITPMDGERVGERTRVTLTLQPGEAAMVLLDRTATPERSCVKKCCVETISLKTWDVTIESWDEGERKTITEDRGLGFETKEVYFETKKTTIALGEVELRPWHEYPAVGVDVSGIGFYRTRFVLPAAYDCAELCIGSTCGNSAAVYVNGQKADAYDFDRKRLDISALLREGENEIMVEVASTLTNRLRARNYYGDTAAYSKSLADNANNAHTVETDTERTESAHTLRYDNVSGLQDYGMVGEVCLRLYRPETD